jgi:hypothetical protein
MSKRSITDVEMIDAFVPTVKTRNAYKRHKANDEHMVDSSADPSAGSSTDAPKSSNVADVADAMQIAVPTLPIKNVILLARESSKPQVEGLRAQISGIVSYYNSIYGAHRLNVSVNELNALVTFEKTVTINTLTRSLSSDALKINVTILSIVNASYADETALRLFSKISKFVTKKIETHIIVLRTDRLCRNPDQYYAFFSDFQKMHRDNEITISSQGLTTKSSSGRNMILRGIMDGHAESKTISERTAFGRAFRVAQNAMASVQI